MAAIDKREFRYQNKKRKLQAFLQLIQTEDQDQMLETEVRVQNNQSDGPVETSDEVKRLQQIIKRKEKKKRPKFRLLDRGHHARFILSDDERQPVDLFDIQSLMLSCILPSSNVPARPTFCEVLKSDLAEKIAIFLLGKEVSFDIDDTEREAHFHEVISFIPDEDFVQRLTLVPLTPSQMRKMTTLTVDKAKDIPPTPSSDTTSPSPITKKDLLLTAAQMKTEGYPLPGDDKFLSSLDRYEPVTENSSMFSLDCEMCITDQKIFEVTRITVVNESEEVILESFVLPSNPITDYVTEYSGVRKEDLEGVTTTLQDIRQKLKEILPPDAILIGQSLNADLVALGIRHPYVIDTSVIYNLTGVRIHKSSLKHLARKFLSIHIQTSESGHCSREDAIAVLRLVQLKLQKGLEFGDCVLCPMEKKALWMKGKGHFVPLSLYLTQKQVDGFITLYDNLNMDNASSKTMFIITDSRMGSASTKDFVLSFLSCPNAGKVICLVITFDGRCYISFK